MALNWKKISVFFLWLVVLFISLKAHTPWRDEYQSWLVSTRTPDLVTFFDGVRYERHPPLHYVLQRGLTNLAPRILNWDPQHAIELFTVPFAIGSAIILIWACGLTLIQSSLLIFGPYFLREFSMISRTYSIGLFFLLAAAAMAQRKRYAYAYALLALGSLTHLLFSWVCGAMFVLLALCDRRRLRDPNFWICGLIFLGAGALQMPPPDSLFSSTPVLNWSSLFSTFKQLNQSLWGLEKIWVAYKWNTMPLATDATAVLLIPALYMIHRYVHLGRFLFVCVPPVFLVASTYTGNSRYLGVTFYGFLACYLSFARPTAKESTLPNPVTAFSFVAIFSSILWWLSWAPFQDKPNYDFSGAREMIHAVQDKLKDGVVLVENDIYFFTWMAETRSPIFSIKRDSELFYPHFKKSEYIYEDAGQWCRERLKDFKKARPDKPIFFGLRKEETFPSDCGKAVKIFSSKRRVITDEEFDIYELAAK